MPFKKFFVYFGFLAALMLVSEAAAHAADAPAKTAVKKAAPVKADAAKVKQPPVKPETSPDDDGDLAAQGKRGSMAHIEDEDGDKAVVDKHGNVLDLAPDGEDEDDEGESAAE